MPQVQSLKKKKKKKKSKKKKKEICFNLSLPLKFERVIRIGSQHLKTRNPCGKEGRQRDASNEYFADKYI